MKQQNRIRFVGIAFLFAIQIIVLDAKEIQIPKCDTLSSTRYLANQLGLNIIHSSYYEHPKANKFSIDASSSKDSIVKAYNERNGFLSMSCDVDNALLISCEKEKGLFFNELLGARLSLDTKQNAFFAMMGRKKYKIMMKGTSSGDHQIEIHDAVIREWGKSCPSNPTLKELILAVFKDEGYSTCVISFWKQPPQEAMDMLKQAVNDGNIDKEVMDELPLIAKDQTLFELGFWNGNDEWRKPTYEQIAECLKSSKRDLRINSPCRNLEFWFRQALTFDTVHFIKYLIEQNIFDLASSRVHMEYLSLVPEIMLDSGDYKSVEYLLGNIDRIKSEKIRSRIVFNFKYLAEKSQMDPESRSLLTSLAQKFNVVKKTAVDTSKWIGDDLPDDYDRWQNFKVPDTEIAFERDKIIDKRTYHLKFLKYKNPVKIGGIPLKSQSQADYSSPERAYFSAASARTPEWDSVSIIDIQNYSSASFDLFAQWKDWHSDMNPFIEILFKVEVEGDKKSDETPDIFLVLKLLNDNKRVVAIPMKRTDGGWKFYLCWPRHVEILSGHIREEIAKNERIAKSDKH